MVLLLHTCDKQLIHLQFAFLKHHFDTVGNSPTHYQQIPILHIFKRSSSDLSICVKRFLIFIFM